MDARDGSPGNADLPIGSSLQRLLARTPIGRSAFPAGWALRRCPSPPDWVRSARRFGGRIWKQSPSLQALASLFLGAGNWVRSAKIARFAVRPRRGKLASFGEIRAVRSSASARKLACSENRIALAPRRERRPSSVLGRNPRPSNGLREPRPLFMGSGVPKWGHDDSFGEIRAVHRSALGAEIGFVWPKSRGSRGLLNCGLPKSEGRRELPASV